jgi:hypothetical protein
MNTDTPTVITDDIRNLRADVHAAREALANAGLRLFAHAVPIADLVRHIIAERDAARATIADLRAMVDSLTESCDAAQAEIDRLTARTDGR